MASIETRPTRTGTAYRVRFRHERRQRVISFDDEDTARRWLALLEAAGPAAALAAFTADEVTRDHTVVGQVRHHIDHLTGVTQGTLAAYRSYLERDLEPRFADLPLVALNRDVVAGWVRWLEQDRGLGGKSIRNRHALLSASLSSAVQAGLITDNPCQGLRLPRSTQQEMCFLTREEFASLLGHIDERYQPLVLLLAGTGMRFGEVTALTVGDVDVATASIRIWQAWKVAEKGRRVLGPPKSEKSRRTVAVATPALRAIEPLLDRPPSALLFEQASGGRVRQGNFHRYTWAPAVAASAGDRVERVQNVTGRYEVRVIERGPGKHPRVHDLRHTYASWAIRAGVALPVLQRQLGHEKITTTVDCYGHLARSDFDGLTGAIGDALTPEVPAAIEGRGV